eukprot:1338249-Amorphochlora_amoeboformis.AAC.2
MACQLPCIDISPWLDSSAPQSSRQEVVSQVGNACENVGFFAVTNLPKKLRRAIEKASQEAGKLFRHLEKNPKLKAKLHDIQRAGVESEGEGRPRAYGYFPMKSEALGYDADVTKKPDLRSFEHTLAILLGNFWWHVINTPPYNPHPDACHILNLTMSFNSM